MYLTQQIQIKKGHKLYPYCKDLCEKSNNLYNRTAFVVRQYVFAKDAIRLDSPMHKNTEKAYELVEKLTKNYALMNYSPPIEVGVSVDSVLPFLNKECRAAILTHHLRLTHVEVGV